METAQLRRLGPTKNILKLKPAPGTVIWLAGRGSNCQIYTKSKYASRNHFSIKCNSNNQYFISDLNSANGTFLNDNKLTSVTALEFGNIISVGVPSEMQDSPDCIVYVFERCLGNQENLPQEPALNNNVFEKSVPTTGVPENRTVSDNSKPADKDSVSTSHDIPVNVEGSSQGVSEEIQAANSVNVEEVSNETVTPNNASNSVPSADVADENQIKETERMSTDAIVESHQPENVVENENQLNNEVTVAPQVNEVISDLEKEHSVEKEKEKEDDNEMDKEEENNEENEEENDDGHENETENTRNENPLPIDEYEDIFSDDDEAYSVCTQVDEEVKEEIEFTPSSHFTTDEEVIEIGDSDDEENVVQILSQQLEKTATVVEVQDDVEEDFDDEVQFLGILPSTHVLRSQNQVKQEVNDQVVPNENEEEEEKEEEEEEFSEQDKKWVGRLFHSQEYKDFKTKLDVVTVIDDEDNDEPKESRKDDEDKVESSKTAIVSEDKSDEEAPVPMEVSTSDEVVADDDLTEVTSTTSSNSLSTDEDLPAAGPSKDVKRRSRSRSPSWKADASPRRSPRKSPQEDIFESTDEDEPVGSRRSPRESSRSPKPPKLTNCFVKLDRLSVEDLIKDDNLPQSPESPSRPKSPETPRSSKSPRPVSPYKRFSPERDKRSFGEEDQLDSAQKSAPDKNATGSKVRRRIASDDELEDDDESWFVTGRKKIKIIGIDEQPPMKTKRQRLQPLFTKTATKLSRKAGPLLPGNLSPRAKINLIKQQRKNKLRELSEKEKNDKAEDCVVRPKVTPANVRVKNTTKSRGDYFISELEKQNTAPTEVKKKPVIAPIKKLPPNAILPPKYPFPEKAPSNSILTSKYPPPEKADTPKKSDLSTDQNETDFGTALFSGDTVLMEKNRRPSSSSKPPKPRRPSGTPKPDNNHIAPPQSNRMSSVRSGAAEAENLPPRPAENSAITNSVPRGILKMTGGGIGRPLSRKVQFDDSRNHIKFFNVEDDDAIFRKLKKKEPLTRDVLINQGDIRYKNIIFNICNWNALWLEECKLARVEELPPICPSKSEVARFLPKKYASHSMYMKSIIPLLLMDLWTNISINWKNNYKNQPRFVVACNSYEQCPKDDVTSNLSAANFEVILQGKENSSWVKEGDLVVINFNLASNNQQSQETLSQGSSKRRTVQCFGYVFKRDIEKISSGLPAIHPSLFHLNLSITNESQLCKLKIFTKRRPNFDVDTQKTMILTVIQNIKSSLTLFKSVCHLPKSLLCDTVLKIAGPQLKLPNLTKRCKVIFNKPLDTTQRELVLKLTASCYKSVPTLHQIQGGAGTGKTYLMIAFILQLLYGEEGKDVVRPKIIYCTQSDSATDEMAHALSKYRQEMDKFGRFKLVRVGYSHTMKPEVRDISSQNLALLNAKKDKVEEERKIAQKQIDKIVTEMQNFDILSEKERNEKSANLTSWMRVKTNIEQGKYENPVTQASYEAECRIIEKADIICTTCTTSGTSKMTRVFNKIAAEGKIKRIICIVDDAMQSKEVETIVPLQLGITNLILIGDLHQLKSSVKSKQAHEFGVGNSLFRRIWNSNKTKESVSPITYLSTQYRMSSVIAEYPNRTFYNNTLKTATDITRRLKTNLKPYVILVNNEKEEISEGEREIRDVRAIESLLRLIKDNLLKSNQENATIAVITHHTNKANFLKSRIKEVYSQNVEISGIERFQGTEFNIVIFLIDGSTASSGQINLALTRARDNLIVAILNSNANKDAQIEKLIEDGNRRHVVRSLSRCFTDEELSKCVMNS